MIRKPVVIVAIMTMAAIVPGSQAAKRLAIIQTAPVSITLAPVKAGATGTTTIRIVAVGRVSTRLTVRLVGPRGASTPLTSTALKPGSRSTAQKPTPKAVRLTTPVPLPLRVTSGRIRTLPIRLTLASTPTQPYEAKLIIATGEAGVRGMTIKLTAALPSASRWSNAYLDPPKLALTTNLCHPKLLNWDCAPPSPQTLKVEGLTPGRPYTKGEVISEANTQADNGGRADVTLRAGEDISATASTGQLIVDVNHVTRDGSYSITLPTAPGVDKAPTLTTDITARAFFLWPLLALSAGAIVAFLLLQRREQSRPKQILEYALKAAASRYDDARSRAANLAQPYTMSDVFPEGDDWTNKQSSDREAVKLFRQIHDADSKEKLDAHGSKVAGVVAAADGWLPTCRRAQALKEAVDKVRGTNGSKKIADASDALLAARKPPEDAAALAKYQRDLDDQTEAVERWAGLDELLTRAQDLYTEVLKRPKLGKEDRAHLAQIPPQALRDEYLADLSNLQQLNASQLDALTREHLRVLKALEIATDPNVDTDETRGGALSVFGAVAVAAPSVPTSLPAAASWSAEDLLATIVRGDRAEFSISFFIATLAFFVVLYPKTTFGSVWDYLAAFAAGAAGQLVVNWQLLPWYRAYKPPTSAPS
jgi:hypothetical protein